MQFAIAHTSWIALVRMISASGSGAVAGYTIGIRIFVFVVLPRGVQWSCCDDGGQNPARKAAACGSGVYTTAAYNALFMAAVAVLFIFKPGMLVGFFTTDPEVSRYAIECLRIVGYGNVAYASAW